MNKQTELDVRIANIDDVEAITQLSNQLGYKAESKEIEFRLTRILSLKDNCVFVATEGDLVIGWIHGFYALRIESASFVEIGGLVIDEINRRKGIGGILVQHVIEWANHMNVATVRVRCNTIRTEAHQFYHRIGFDELKEQKIFSRKVNK